MTGRSVFRNHDLAALLMKAINLGIIGLMKMNAVPVVLFGARSRIFAVIDEGIGINAQEMIRATQLVAVLHVNRTYDQITFTLGL